MSINMPPMQMPVQQNLTRSVSNGQTVQTPSVQNAVPNQTNMMPNPGADMLTLTTPSSPAPKPEPRFAGWGTFMKLLPFVEVGLKYGNNRLDESMKRDEHRRKARERYEKIGSSYREYDHRGHHYRTVTRIKVVDGNGKVLSRHERVGRWHRAR